MRPSRGRNPKTAFQTPHTPQANLSMTINNEELFGKFKPGQTFYLDFIEADAEGEGE